MELVALHIDAKELRVTKDKWLKETVVDFDGWDAECLGLGLELDLGMDDLVDFVSLLLMVPVDGVVGGDVSLDV